MRKTLLRIPVALGLALTLGGCADSPTAPLVGTRFEVQVVPGETFTILLQDSATIATARTLLHTDGTIVVHGELARGDGGFNTGYSWHLKPATVTFVDLAMEICDGRPSFVEEELEYFLDEVKYYCPWGATIVEEL